MSFTTIERAIIKSEGFPEPFDLTPEVVGAIPKAGLTLLAEIPPLQEEESRLIDTINAKAPTESGYRMTQGVVSVCEDADDWAVATVGERRDLEDIQERISDLLSQALDAGLGRLGIVQRQCEVYKVAA